MQSERLRCLNLHLATDRSSIRFPDTARGSCQPNRAAALTIAGPPIEVFDPHFHIWDTLRYADPITCFNPDGAAKEGVYDAADFEEDWRSLPAGFVHTGGVFVEAISCCYKNKSHRAGAVLPPRG